MIRVAIAGRLHADHMATLLNENISAGGTTALTILANSEDILAWMARFPDRSHWVVADIRSDKVGGFAYTRSRGVES